MTRFIFLGVASFLSAAINSGSRKQYPEPGAYAFHYPNGDLGIASALSQRRAVVVGGGCSRRRGISTAFPFIGADARLHGALVGAGAPPAACNRRSPSTCISTDP
jgi:hypothetical protein